MGARASLCGSVLPAYWLMAAVRIGFVSVTVLPVLFVCFFSFVHLVFVRFPLVIASNM